MRTQVAQSRPSSTSAVSLLNEALPWEVDLIVIANVDNSTRTFSIYHDADGTTYDESTALLFEATICPGSVVHYEPIRGIANTNQAGNLGVRSYTSQALTFTAYGEIKGERY